MAWDAREPIDARIDTAGREGLTGTAPASVYKPLREPEQVTLAPDGRPMDVQPAWRWEFRKRDLESSIALCYSSQEVIRDETE